MQAIYTVYYQYQWIQSSGFLRMMPDVLDMGKLSGMTRATFDALQRSMHVAQCMTLDRF